MIYVIDTDSLIALRRTYYPEHFYKLWEQLDELITTGNLISTRINFEELKVEESDDIFAEWKNTHSDMFLEPDEDIQRYVTEILERYPDLIDVNSDREQADPYLIALAIVKNGTVISEETPLSREAINDPNRKKKIKIPNVCQEYGITCMKLIPFINSTEWRKI